MLIGHKEKWRIELLQPKMECMTLFLNLVMPREELSGQQTTNASLGRGLIEKKAIPIKEISLEAEKMNATHDRFRRTDLSKKYFRIHVTRMNETTQVGYFLVLRSDLGDGTLHS